MQQQQGRNQYEQKLYYVRKRGNHSRKRWNEEILRNGQNIQSYKNQCGNFVSSIRKLYGIPDNTQVKQREVEHDLSKFGSFERSENRKEKEERKKAGDFMFSAFCIITGILWTLTLIIR